MSQPHKIKYPLLFTWLCISSALFGVAWVTMFIIMLIYSNQGSIPVALFPGVALDYLHAGAGFILIEIFLTISGLAAVFLMWKRKKVGFYLYSFCKTTLYFLPVAVIGNNHLAFFPLVITATLIFLYGLVFSNH